MGYCFGPVRVQRLPNIKALATAIGYPPKLTVRLSIVKGKGP